MLIGMTNGINVPEEFLDGMRERGWEIDVTDRKIQIMDTFNYPGMDSVLDTGDVTCVTTYTAQKPDKNNAGNMLDETSGEWKKDAREILMGDPPSDDQMLEISHKPKELSAPKTPGH